MKRMKMTASLQSPPDEAPYPVLTRAAHRKEDEGESKYCKAQSVQLK